MRAAVVERYGPPEVVRIMELPRPTPRAGEVLVRVTAAAVTSADARIRAARFPRGFGAMSRLIFGLRGPRQPVLGSAYSGVVTEVGSGVSRLAVGDAVCGMAGMKLGAHAEYLTVRADAVSLRPSTVTDDDAAGVLFGGSTALNYLRDRARLRPGETALVNGASGAVGTNAVQLARHFGAEVTALTSAPNAALIGELGAHRVIDYRQHAPEQITDRYDVVLDAVGNLSIAAGRRLLNHGGRLLLVVADLGQLLQARGNVMAGPAPETREDTDFLLALIGSSQLRVVHDSQFTLDDIAHAHRRVDTGRKVGNVIIRAR
jgi:NADPH:quinone reductase-like Zn-dependent oxidoreductase